jgi:hypothetical protein
MFAKLSIALSAAAIAHSIVEDTLHLQLASSSVSQ